MWWLVDLVERNLLYLTSLFSRASLVVTHHSCTLITNNSDFLQTWPLFTLRLLKFYIMHPDRKTLITYKRLWKTNFVSREGFQPASPSILIQGRIWQIQKEGAESPHSPPPSQMKTSLFRTCSLQHCGQSKVTLTYQAIEWKSML